MKLKNILITTLAIAFTISFFIFLSQVIIAKNFIPSSSQDKKIKILIVPGHEPNAGGADEFKKIKERDLNLQLANSIKEKLSLNFSLEVLTARDNDGWNSDLKNYVMISSSTIMNWVSDMKNIMFSKIDTGEFTIINSGMKHNEATSSAVLFLYGTNKWITENDIDLVLHVHFNSNPKINGKPNFHGYCMYIPEHQYSNSSSSRIFANYLNEEISKIQKPSNMPQEKNIIIESQELIATGNYDTLKIPSVVVEYAYIYEPMMTSSSTRNKFIETAASSTATAINNYIETEFK